MLIFTILELVYVGFVIFFVETIFMQKDVYPASLIESFSSGMSQIAMAFMGLFLFLV